MLIDTGPPFVFYMQGFLMSIEMCHLQRPLKLPPVISGAYSHGENNLADGGIVQKCFID